MQCIDTLTMKKLKILDLFSGIGGFSLGLEATGGFETSAFCDIDPYCRKVLQQHWPNVPIYEDIKKLKGTDIGTVDIITGGYPCQPFSVAGKQKGVEDKRHLWPDMFRIIKECKPTWVIGENVGGHIKLGLDSVLQDLESEGYTVRAFSISASSVGANHQRERVWTVGYSEHSYAMEDTRQYGRRIESTWDTESIGSGTSEETQWTTNSNQINGSGEGAALMGEATDTDSQRLHGLGTEHELREGKTKGTSSWERWWEFEPDVGRVVNGVPNRVDRIKALGNSLVPQIPFYIGQTILRTYEDNDSV